MSNRQFLFYRCIADLLTEDRVQAMSQVTQHVGSVNCLHHCLFVAYLSFLLCRLFRWKSRDAARGGLLHDMFLYDQHDQENKKGHWKNHPQAALDQARQICPLTYREENCIGAHMWPLTKARPRCREAWVVNMTDTLCAALEWMHVYHLLRMGKKFDALLEVPEGIAA